MGGGPGGFRASRFRSLQTPQTCTAAGATWTLVRETDRWTLLRGEPDAITTRVRISDDDAWQLLFNALPEREAARAVRIEGRADLARPLLRARSVLV